MCQMWITLALYAVVFLTVSAKAAVDEDDKNDERVKPNHVTLPEERSSLTEEKYQNLMKKFRLQEDQTIFFIKTQLDENPAGKTKLSEVFKLLGKSLKFINQYDNMAEFLACKRCNPTVLPLISVRFPETKQHFLMILKSLIEIAPDDIKSNFPLDVCDKVVDIFVRDKNATTKCAALKVLAKWMPCNPPVQLRVLGSKDLEPLYTQLDKLDMKGVYTFLALFNKLVNEHNSNMDENRQHTDEDVEKGRIYKQIALLEQLASAKICDTLLEFLNKIFKIDKEKDNVMVPIFELIKHISQPCMPFLKRSNKSILYFKAVHDYAIKPEVQEYYQNLKLNISESVLPVLEEYLHELTPAKKTEL